MRASTPTTLPAPTYAWANARDVAVIRQKLRLLGRQTMNIDRMPEARFVVARDPQGRLIGWAGLDVAHRPTHPELFSLYVEPAHRHAGVGLALERERLRFLSLNGHVRAYVRMTDDDENRALLSKRLATRTYREIAPGELDEAYVNMCHACELFGHGCAKRVFLEIDVLGFLDYLGFTS